LIRGIEELLANPHVPILEAHFEKSTLFLLLLLLQELMFHCISTHVTISPILRELDPGIVEFHIHRKFVLTTFPFFLDSLGHALV
jgi:hypothetical protein